MLGVIMDYTDDKLFGPHFNKCIILRLNFCARFLCTKCMNPGGHVTACNQTQKLGAKYLVQIWFEEYNQHKSYAFKHEQIKIMSKTTISIYRRFAIDRERLWYYVHISSYDLHRKIIWRSNFIFLLFFYSLDG